MRYPNIEAERIRMELTEAALAKSIGVTARTVSVDLLELYRRE